MPDRIVITAATGNIGSKLAEILLSKGKRIKVIGRDDKKLEAFKMKGADVYEGNAEKASDMKRAFMGGSALFALIPPNYAATDPRAYQNKVGQAYADAIAEAGIKEVVNLSSVGAHLSEGNGLIAGLYDQEQRLNSMRGVSVVHLRPGYFMENLFWNMDSIRKSGIAGSPLKGDVALPMIATRDIASIAAVQFLVGVEGKSVQELMGQRDLTLNEATAAIGKAIGKPDLKYVQFPYADAEKSMVGMGMSLESAQLTNEMNKGFNEGIIKPSQSRKHENTTLTSIEDFAQHFAEIYRQRG